MLNVNQCSTLDGDALSVLVSSLAKILDFVEGLSNSIDGNSKSPSFLDQRSFSFREWGAHNCDHKVFALCMAIKLNLQDFVGITTSFALSLNL